MAKTLNTSRVILRGAQRVPARRRVHAQMNVLYFFPYDIDCDVAEFGVV